VRTSVFSIGDAIEQDEMDRIGRALQLAERNILRCDTIISELLDYTRDRTPQMSPTHIDAWLDNVLDEVLDQRSIPGDIACARELNADIEVSIDSEHMRQVIVNVVNNAIDAMQEKPSEEKNLLTVSTHVDDERLEIQISDTGSGISDAGMDRLFEPLFSTKSFGVGLGLLIVKNIMEQHAGGIEINSQLGVGTTVVLWLPAPDQEIAKSPSAQNILTQAKR
jgi:signal transduction histidine kinase